MPSLLTPASCSTRATLCNSAFLCIEHYESVQHDAPFNRKRANAHVSWVFSCFENHFPRSEKMRSPEKKGHKNLRGRTLRTGTTVVTVTFKNIKTAKSTAKKYRCVVKAAIEEEPTPVEPEKPATATKISSVEPTAADTIEVKFDAPVADATKEVKLDRAGSAVEATAKWSDSKNTVVLTGKKAFVAGAYTVTFGDMSGSCVITERKATSIEILTTKVGLGTNLGTDQKVYFNVLDQYGKEMGFSMARLNISATNMTKGRNVTSTSTNTVTARPYFMVNTKTPDDAIGDKITVVASLKTDPTIIKTADLTIDNIYTDGFEFGEVDLAGDEHVYVNQLNKYSLKYTATDSEGNAVTLSKTSGTTRTTNNITFVSSNESIIDPDDMKVDASGKLYFTTGDFAGKVTLTAVNNVTGKTASTELIVGTRSKATKLEIADVTIARKDYAADTTIGKADVTVYDQYGDVMKPADVAKLDLAAELFKVTFGFNGETIKTVISDDGKYLVYKTASSTIQLSKPSVGASYNVNFVSTVDATVSSVGHIIIGDENDSAYLKVDTAPDSVVVIGSTVNAKVKIVDLYDNALKVTAKVTGSGVTPAPVKDGSTVIGSLEADVTGSDLVSECAIESTVNDITTVKFVLKNASAMTELYDNATLRIVLKNKNGEDLDAKNFTIAISNDATKYDVSTDKNVYSTGETMKVTVKALKGTDFLNKYKGTVAVTVAAISGSSLVKGFNKDLVFENGTATVEIPALTNVTKITVGKVANGTVAGDKTGLTVSQNGSKAYLAIATTGAVTVNDVADAAVTSYNGWKTATIKVTNSAGVDVTGSFCTALSLNGASGIVDSTGNVSLNFGSGVANEIKTKLGGKDLSNLTSVATNDIPVGIYKLTITVDGLSGTISVNVAS